MSDDSSLFDQFIERYAAGEVPWDEIIPPPEIVALASDLPPGRALDLGSGFGRTAIHLAKLGWTVDGVDFVPEAVEIARDRAAAAGVGDRARFHQASVADLGFLVPPYDLAIDIGCMHSFTDDLLNAYRTELTRLLRAGSRFVLFAHLRDDQTVEDIRPRGIRESTVMTLLEDDFHLDKVEYGVTQIADHPAWNSAWYWFRRR